MMKAYIRALSAVLALGFTTACGSSPPAISSPPSSVATLSGKFEICEPYAGSIKAFSERYLPWEWHWIAAQIYQESLCNPRAVSHVGAQGLGQFMPGTWADMSRALGWENVSPFSAKPNIHATNLYMSRLCKNFDRRGRPAARIMELCQASYNTGIGNVLKAQRKCDDARDWPDIQPCLVQVTGPNNSHETTTYVSRIARWFGEMKS